MSEINLIKNIKKNKGYFSLVIVAAVLVIVFAVMCAVYFVQSSEAKAFDETSPTSKFQKADETIIFTLKDKKLTLSAGESGRVEVASPTNKTKKYVVFKSSDSGIVRVDSDGTVYGLKKGTAAVTASAGYYSVSCRITVKKAEDKLTYSTAIVANRAVLRKNLRNKSKYPYYVKVNRLKNCVTVYTYDKNGDYTVPVRAMVCSCGDNNGTPAGIYSAGDNRYRWHSLFGNVEGQYITGITGDILFHSVPYEGKSPDTLEADEYNSLGKSVSMGCVRLACADAKWIYKNCRAGTAVEIYDSKDAGPLGKPSSMHISSRSKWDPTDDSKKNPYRKKRPSITGAGTIKVKKGTASKDITFLSGVKAKDTCGNDITDRVEYTTDANLKKSGRYTVVYKVQDDMKRTGTAYATLVVE